MNDMTVRQKGMNLRSYLQKSEIKNTLAAALPQWLSVDRLLRIVFSSAMRNPKILECSQESILQSAMMCAQLGLEPILGRAYLIPYHNTKYVDGRQIKVYECQMQPGYQGLIDLARRSGNIADVWGANVYENDEFELDYGMDRKLRHRPWHMDPEKRAKGGGEILGAYVVWLLKDGTKHPEYMPIHEIHKRREKSQSYRWAETGDPKRGGGKRDSIWHEWPEDQNLKTVLKHSSKFVPSSIEFMTAIEADNDAEIGRPQTNMMFSLPTPDEPTDDDLISAFNLKVNEEVDEAHHGNLSIFIKRVAEDNETTADAVMVETMKTGTFETFIEAFMKATSSPEKEPEPEADEDAPGDDEAGQYNPLNEPVMGKYTKGKATVIRAMCDERGIDHSKLNNKAAHEALYAYEAGGEPAGDPDETEKEPDSDPIESNQANGGPDSSESEGDEDNGQTLQQEMDTINRFNELWRDFLTSGNKAASDYAGEKAGCETTANGHFAKPNVKQMKRWVAAAEEFLKADKF